ncbi:MAG: hypothetical protein UR90_C0024G0004 [Parcubacteria group bacterium GW2011_GWC1_35_8]|nr:MAG: hypothetical protein UR90_C0024G0004 [Parcubacteria group bacterium GW2011_GWC1_35_8]OGJ14492.1 MAG: hypothetical protein A2554_01495 [Candidatus Nomurabacteria bacterium RIFOXYD2_FULL_35_12]
MQNFYRKGVTVVELLIVIAVLGIIFLIVLPQFSKSRENQVLKNGVADILSSVNKARGNTLASLNSSEYGIHFQIDRVVIFKGTSFSSEDSNNEIINITTPANISDITLLGGVSDIYFHRLTGAPSTTGTITISTGSYSKVITILATGVVSVN